MHSPSIAGAPGRVSLLPASLQAGLRSLVSFEALLTLYLFAGMYKGDPRFDWIPADPTGLFFALSVVLGALILIARPLPRQGLRSVLAGGALAGWFALSLFWSPSHVYGPQKAFYLATLALWALVAGALIVAPDPARLRRLCTVLLVAASLAALEAVVVYLDVGGGPLRVGSGNYIALGRLCGLGAVIVFVAWASSRQRFGVYGLGCLALLALLCFVLLIGGGRGPLLATAASLLVALLATVRLGRSGFRLVGRQAPALALALLVVLAAVIWVQVVGETPETIERLEGMTSEEGLAGSALGRVEAWRTALALWDQALLTGHGAGSWPLLNDAPDVARYPHNLFAEMAVEGGLVGVVLLLALLLVALWPVSLAKLRDDPLLMCVLMLFINTFVNAMVSGDLPGNRALFLAIGLLSAFAMARRGGPARRRRRRGAADATPAAASPDRFRWPSSSPFAIGGTGLAPALREVRASVASPVS